LLTETARQLANLGLLPWIAAMEFSTFFFLLASPLILLGLAEQTRQLTERLHVAEQLQQAKSAFLAKISHELRSPLNTILGYNRMLARGTAKLTLAEGTAGIEKSALRLLSLIDELLDEARAAAGQLTIAPAPLSLRPWLDDICSTFMINAEATHNRFLCTISGELPALIEVDGGRLRQVLDNLLNNANRHTRQGTITLACTARIVGQEALLDFSVADDGDGIPADRLPAIFEPFVRGHVASKDALPSGGVGLGLPICRELVRQMGSEIAVTSAPGKGSCFSFSLRCRILAAESSHPHAPTALPQDTGPRVLLVDDDDAQLGLLADLFEQSGFAVGAAAGGHAALELLDQADWDVLITDQMMPEVDGWSVLHRVRTARPELPVILLSAMEPCQPADFPADVRFDAILLKPASPEDVLATAWLLILRVGSGGTVPAWATLARLAGEGDVSGIEDWIAACRAAAPEHEPSMRWVEDILQRLNLPLLERFAELAAHRSGTPL
jgi:signal transduction histidine kinase/CheY-like chemotaxis protein